jgi:hypothetical protein
MQIYFLLNIRQITKTFQAHTTHDHIHSTNKISFNKITTTAIDILFLFPWIDALYLTKHNQLNVLIHFPLNKILKQLEKSKGGNGRHCYK